MAEIILNGSQIMAAVGEREAAGVAEHVGMSASQSGPRHG